MTKTDEKRETETVSPGPCVRGGGGGWKERRRKDAKPEGRGACTMGKIGRGGKKAPLLMRRRRKERERERGQNE